MKQPTVPPNRIYAAAGTPLPDPRPTGVGRGARSIAYSRLNPASPLRFCLLGLLLPLVLWAAPAQRGATREEGGNSWVTPVVHAPGVEQRIFKSAAARTNVSFFILKPQQYEREKQQRFPVLYWLHGTGGGLAGVAKLAGHFGAAMRAGSIPPMLVVFPNGLTKSMWCDSVDGTMPVETMLVKELVPYVDTTFRTLTNRSGRIIEGFSMGGYGAARLGFKYHDLFGAISILAGGPLDLQFNGPRAAAKPEERNRMLSAVYGTLDGFRAQSPVVLADQNAAAVRGKTKLRMATGARDFTLDLNRKFSEHLNKLNVPHSFTVPPGVGHDAMGLLNALGEANWEFYRSALREGEHPRQP